MGNRRCGHADLKKCACKLHQQKFYLLFCKGDWCFRIFFLIPGVWQSIVISLIILLFWKSFTAFHFPDRFRVKIKGNGKTEIISEQIFLSRFDTLHINIILLCILYGDYLKTFEKCLFTFQVLFLCFPVTLHHNLLVLGMIRDEKLQVSFWKKKN